MPIIVRFDRPVANKAAVEKAMTVTSQTPNVGAWVWLTDSSGIQEAVFRTKSYWAANQQITFTA
jgi:hypothetical protein